MIFTVYEDQWGHSFFEIREAKLFSCHDDNKEQTFTESEVNIPHFLQANKEKTERPYPELLAELRRLTDDRNP